MVKLSIPTGTQYTDKKRKSENFKESKTYSTGLTLFSSGNPSKIQDSKILLLGIGDSKVLLCLFPGFRD